MSATRIPEAVRRIFTETFAAHDIAEPLASFDADTAAVEVREFMAASDYDVVGIRRDGLVSGFVERDALAAGKCGNYFRPLADATVLVDDTVLLTVVTELNARPFLLITAFGSVGGIVTRADLLKPPVRMWLFGIVTLIEMRFSDLIERYCPGDGWKQFLSEARQAKAAALLAERQRRNQALRVFDCLQFGDKGQIVARNEEVRKHTVFPSRRQAEEAVRKLEHLRNNLAHAQDIVAADWDTIIRLCEFFKQPGSANIAPAKKVIP